jgi:sugar diacid utilization regulator
VQHAEQGTSLAALLAGCHAAARVVLTVGLADAGLTEAARREFGAAILDRLEQVTTVVAEAYFDEQQAIRAEERDARRALATALVSGEHVEQPATQLGIRIAPAYIALALQLEPRSRTDGPVAARQRLRRLQDRLDAFAGEQVLSLLDPTSGIALLPSTAGEVTPMLDRVASLLDDIAAVTRTNVTAGAAACVGVIAVSRAARQARDVLAIARRLGRPPGLYVLDDVLLEYQLTRESDARPLLAGLLDPLEPNPDLMHTLECYLENELDRRSTATLLHVHPNTLDYRLRRIAQLTGLDPGRPSGQQLLAAALTARRLV